ncbi:MAG TPA: hypothetical protein VMV27_16260 [Candidatus Binataceae bacterium]|nr:hypothetical protein [Candidatus Binataceae bacterium]
MRSRRYLGNSFEVWNRERAWYWSVAGFDVGGGAIGAAATYADAVGEARMAIDEMSAMDSAPMREGRRCGRAGMFDWNGPLENLERYLVCVHSAAA